MASSLLALLDDIATILDDVSVMTKVAAKKTAGVLGDDLALNAQQVSGVNPERELPVVWAVAKGSFVNKLILVPSALAISALAAWAETPWLLLSLLMLGGAYLCFEGFEKLAHKFLHSKAEEDAHHAELTHALIDPSVDLVAVEKDKIKGAIRTDFVLSAEIIVITLGTVAAEPFTKQVAVLSTIAVIMTIGVYGLVAGIVKLDDGGLYLSKKDNQALRGIGNGILRTAPYLMKTLSVVGTAAMFMVGGHILVEGVPAVHHFVENLAHGAGAVAGIGGLLEAVLPTLLDAVIGVLAGAAILVGMIGVQRMLGKKS